mmetsp:Transcript_75536/g.157558  ORF Transcript_75536/g.157558 Transcript_75536/m.157558 type:complete len:259 (-) Transcript_75536:571-1347(-)
MAREEELVALVLELHEEVSDEPHDGRCLANHPPMGPTDAITLSQVDPHWQRVQIRHDICCRLRTRNQHCSTLGRPVNGKNEGRLTTPTLRGEKCHLPLSVGKSEQSLGFCGCLCVGDVARQWVHLQELLQLLRLGHGAIRVLALVGHRIQPRSIPSLHEEVIKGGCQLRHVVCRIFLLYHHGLHRGRTRGLFERPSRCIRILPRGHHAAGGDQGGHQAQGLLHLALVEGERAVLHDAVEDLRPSDRVDGHTRDQPQDV